MKKAIVTGANGFVGTWLTKELVSRGVCVYAIIKDENENISAISELAGVKIIYCGLDNIRSLPQKISDRDISCFYHLAWAGSGGALRADYKVQLKNAEYSCDAAEAAKEIGCVNFLAAGSITEKTADQTLVLDNVSQNMMYGICKRTTHLLLNVFCKTIGIKLIWMRFSNIYGPGDVTGNLISYTLNNLLNGKRPSFSKGTQPYDFIYIKDLAYAQYLLGEKDAPAGDYFLGSGESRKLCDYISEIPKIIGSTCGVGIGERAEDGITYDKSWFDTSKLQNATGFKPQFDFEDGIKVTAEWIRNERDNK